MEYKWLAIINDKEKSKDRDVNQLSEFIGSMFEHLMQEGHLSMNEQFEKIQVKDVNVSLLVAIIRTTFSFRKNMSHWSELRDKIAEEIQSKNLDSKKILRGLY